VSASTTSRAAIAVIILAFPGCGGPRPLDTGAPLIDDHRPLSHLLWQKDLGRSLEFPPLSVDGSWLAAPTGGALYRLDAATGNEMWKRKLPASPTASPLLLGEVVVGATDAPEGEVVGVDLDSGEELWKWGRALALPAGQDSMLVLATRAGRVIRLDPRDGTEVWQIELEGAGWKSPSFFPHRAWIAVPVRPDSVVALRVTDGGRIWSSRVGSWPQVGCGDSLLAVATDDSTLLVLDVETGETQESVRIDAMPAGPPVVENELVHLALRNGSVLAMDLGRLELVWKCDLDPPLVSAPLVHEHFVLQAAPRGRVYGLDRTTGNVVGVLNHPETLVASPRAGGEEVAVGGHKGTLGVYRRNP
jgi:outer membrane protein assembly factor BamB